MKIASRNSIIQEPTNISRYLVPSDAANHGSLVPYRLLLCLLPPHENNPLFLSSLPPLNPSARPRALNIKQVISSDILRTHHQERLDSKD